MRAHSLELTQTLILIYPDGRYQIDMICDLDPLALGVAPSTDNALVLAELDALGVDERDRLASKLRSTFQRRVRVLFDGDAASPQVSFPHYATAMARQGDPPSLFGFVARLEGTVPQGAQGLQMRASRAFPPLLLNVVHLGTTVDGGRLPVEPGAESVVIDLAEATGSGSESASVAAPWPTFTSYLKLGFHHILPAGLDHVLFVIGLFLLNSRLRPLLYQVTAFTIAHAITLALATLGWVTVSPRLVEPLIAFSIAWVALEAVWWNRRNAQSQGAQGTPSGDGETLPSWRLPMIFLLGLLHGLGFAGVLAEVGLPESQLPTALLSFNLGIEIGQVCVILLALMTLGWWRRRPWYASRIVLPIALVMAAVGLWWTFERLFL